MFRSSTWAAGLVALAAGAGAAVCGIELEAAPPRGSDAQLLYLPQGKHLAVTSLGERQLLADLIYLWAIQYYGHYEIANRYDYLDKIFREVITELDPRYVDPYWIGALIMSVETRDLDRALALLDKGIAANPDQWVLPYLAGWECYHAQRYDRAASYFEKAIAVPGAPTVIRRAYAAIFQKQGDLRTSLSAWRSIADDPAMDERGRQIALRHVRELQVEVDLADLRALIDRWTAARGSPPGSLEALARSGWIRQAPLDPDGKPYRYDRSTGQVRAQGSLVVAR